MGIGNYSSCQQHPLFVEYLAVIQVPCLELTNISLLFNSADFFLNYEIHITYNLYVKVYIIVKWL